MEDKNMLTVRSLFRHAFFALPTKFCARVLMAAIWGLLLCSEKDFPMPVRLAFGAVLGLAMLGCSVAFFGWDRGRLDASRLALYGLYVAGEMLVVGTLCFAFLGTFCGRLEPVAMLLCGFGGSLFTTYPMVQLYARNILKSRGIVD